MLAAQETKLHSTIVAVIHVVSYRLVVKIMKTIDISSLDCLILLLFVMATS